MRYPIDFDCVDFHVFLCTTCLVFFFVFNFYFWFHLFSIIGIWFPLHCIFQWDVIFLFSNFHRISVSLPSIYKRITGFFRFLRSQSSLGRCTSSISLLRIPCSLLYRIVRYLCYFLVLFVDWCACDKIYFSCVFFCVCLCGLCLVCYFSFLWLCVRRISFLFRCTLPCDATFLFWPFHRILVSLPTINMCT